MTKLLAKALLLSGFALATLGAQAADQAVADLYNKSCVFCHSTGAAGAPRFREAQEWAPRLAKGMDALVTSVDQGMNAMMAKGMCYDCTAEEFKALIEYMTVVE